MIRLLSSNTRDYWRFYWPLATLSFITLLGSQLQVMTLARYPDGVRELANIAVAGAMFTMFYSSLFFIPQLTNVFSDSFASRHKVFWFVCYGSGLLTLIFALVGWTPAGRWLIETLFPRQGTDLPLHDIQIYCRWLTPVLFLDGLRSYYMGLLIQNRKTGMVSLLNTVSLLLTAGMLYRGYQMQLAAPMVAGGSQLFSATLTLGLAWCVYKRRYNQTEPENAAIPSFKELWRFFFPIAMTGIFFAVSRPILISFAGRTENAEILIAVSRVTFEISFFLVAPMNQFRNLYVTFGKTDLRGVRDFSVLVLIAISALAVIILTTPLSTILFEDIYGLQDSLQSMVTQSAWMLILLPLVLTIRNYYHGLCMIHKATGSMGYAGMFRVSSLALAAWALTSIGWLNQWTMPLSLMLGFAVETAIVAWRVRRQIPS